MYGAAGNLGWDNNGGGGGADTIAVLRDGVMLDPAVSAVNFTGNGATTTNPAPGAVTHKVDAPIVSDGVDEVDPVHIMVMAHSTFQKVAPGSGIMDVGLPLEIGGVEKNPIMQRINFVAGAGISIVSTPEINGTSTITISLI